MPSANSETKLVNDLVDRIHAKIMRGEYDPGTRLRQEVLAEEFQVSRTPIREALRLLEAKGVISQTHRHSAVVRAPSSREIREIYRIRAELEGLAADLAARQISDHQLDRLREEHDRFVRAVTLLGNERDNRKQPGARPISAKALAKASSSWIETNAKFHDIIHDASNNRCLKRFLADLVLGFTHNVMLSSARGMDLSRMQRNVKDHERILLALEHRDAETARKAMSEHILESGDFVILWLENHLSPA